MCSAQCMLSGGHMCLVQVHTPDLLHKPPGQDWLSVVTGVRSGEGDSTQIRCKWEQVVCREFSRWRQKTDEKRAEEEINRGLNYGSYRALAWATEKQRGEVVVAKDEPGGLHQGEPPGDCHRPLHPRPSRIFQLWRLFKIFTSRECGQLERGEIS